jgi:hypothetical protein
MAKSAADLEVDVLRRQADIERSWGRRIFLVGAVVVLTGAAIVILNVLALLAIRHVLTHDLAVRDATIRGYQDGVPKLVNEVVLLQTQVRRLGGTPAPFTIQITPRP